jgi:hypothetical protein
VPHINEHKFAVLEPDILDQDMTPSDFVLEHLHFGRNGLGMVKLDGPVRDYLISALRRNHGPACPR